MAPHKHELPIFLVKFTGEGASRTLSLGVSVTKVLLGDCIIANKFQGYLINFKHFHELYESNNPPKCSAKDMAEQEEDKDAVFSIGADGSTTLEQEKFAHFLWRRRFPGVFRPFKKYSC